MTAIYSFMTEEERTDAVREAVLDHELLRLNYMFERLQMDHELRLQEIETECMMNEYTEYDLGNMYTNEMDIYLEAANGWWSKFKGWVSNVINTAFGKKKKINPNDVPKENQQQMIELPLDPALLEGTVNKSIVIINNIPQYVKSDGTVDKQKCGRALGINIGGGAIAAGILAFLGYTKVKKTVKEVTEIRNRLFKPFDILRQAVEKRPDPKDEKQVKENQAVKEIATPILNTGRKLLGEIDKIPFIGGLVDNVQRGAEIISGKREVGDGAHRRGQPPATGQKKKPVQSPEKGKPQAQGKPPVQGRQQPEQPPKPGGARKPTPTGTGEQRSAPKPAQPQAAKQEPKKAAPQPKTQQPEKKPEASPKPAEPAPTRQPAKPAEQPAGEKKPPEKKDNPPAEMTSGGAKKATPKNPIDASIAALREQHQDDKGARASLAIISTVMKGLSEKSSGSLKVGEIRAGIDAFKYKNGNSLSKGEKATVNKWLDTVLKHAQTPQETKESADYDFDLRDFLTPEGFLDLL